MLATESNMWKYRRGMGRLGLGEQGRGQCPWQHDQSKIFRVPISRWVGIWRHCDPSQQDQCHGTLAAVGRAGMQNPPPKKKHGCRAVLSTYFYDGKKFQGCRGQKVQRFPPVAILIGYQERYYGQALVLREIRHSGQMVLGSFNLNRFL